MLGPPGVPGTGAAAAAAAWLVAGAEEVGTGDSAAAGREAEVEAGALSVGAGREMEVEAGVLSVGAAPAMIDEASSGPMVRVVVTPLWLPAALGPRTS